MTSEFIFEIRIMYDVRNRSTNQKPSWDVVGITSSVATVTFKTATDSCVLLVLLFNNIVIVNIN